MTYKLLTDSCCDLPYTWLDEHDVSFIPMSVLLDDQEYFDDLGKTFKASWLLDQLSQGKMPTTSQINPGRYLEFFKEYAKDNIPVLYLCFSSGLSGSYQSALQAVDLVKEEYPEADITVFDTKNAALGEGLVVYYAAKMKEEGKSLSEVLAWLMENAIRVHSYVKVEDLDHLKRGGRISKTAAVLGGLMNIKPILIMDAEGKLQNVGKIRGSQKALDHLVDETVKTIEHPEDQTLFIAHSGDLASAEKVKEKLMEKVHPKEIIIHSLGPVISSHTGIGCIAVFSLGSKRV